MALKFDKDPGSRVSTVRPNNKPQKHLSIQLAFPKISMWAIFLIDFFSDTNITPVYFYTKPCREVTLIHLHVLAALRLLP